MKDKNQLWYVVDKGTNNRMTTRNKDENLIFQNIEECKKEVERYSEWNDDINYELISISEYEETFLKTEDESENND